MQLRLASEFGNIIRVPSELDRKTIDAMSTTRTTTALPILNVADARQITGSAYINRKEAAAYMCVSEKYLATHLHDGPKRLQLGRKVVYRLSDIENFMHQMEVN